MRVRSGPSVTPVPGEQRAVRVHGGEVVAKAEDECLQRFAHLGVDQGRPAVAPGIEQSSDAGALWQVPHLAAPAADNAAGDVGLGRRNSVGVASRDAERNQALGAADGGEPVTGLVTLILIGALLRRLVGQEHPRFCVVERAGLGVVDSAFALDERGCSLQKHRVQCSPGSSSILDASRSAVML